MDVMLHITCADAAKIAGPLAGALTDAGVTWGCFLTNDGVKVVTDPGFAAASTGATRVAVCEHSWDQLMPGTDCPAELGSQTVNSLMMMDAARVVSL